MINVEKQVTYWRDGAVEDWDVGQGLIHEGKIRHGLFFTHLSLEKLLKAHVCHHTQELAPRIHNLVRLAELAALTLNDEQMDVLADMNAFNLEGRYPDSFAPPPTLAEAKIYLERAEELYQWLINQLSIP